MTEEEQDWFDPSPFIDGSEKLTSIVGEWPSFDDAEVISIVLDIQDGSPWKLGSGSPTINLKVRLAEAGYHLVEIQFRRVDKVALQDFRNQNSIREIVFDRLPERLDAQGKPWPVMIFSAEIIEHCGLKGTFEFQSAVVLYVLPCDSDGRLQSPNDPDSRTSQPR